MVLVFLVGMNAVLDQTFRILLQVLIGMLDLERLAMLDVMREEIQLDVPLNS
ncbi:MAG: hypothetical protein H0U57_07200 [Tatlockia sp.]|nr:hypothetical protein [Tatlockia sp.]